MGRLILFLLQLVVGWFAGQAIVEKWLSFGGPLQLFIYAIMFAVLAWICGLVAAELLQGVAKPSQQTLLASVVIAAIVAAVIIFVPQVKSLLAGIRGVDSTLLVLIAAVLGYHARR
ncbi:MAG: hypothetical protein R3D33_00050 [Hyphomicrobiaceae bacterium]